MTIQTNVLNLTENEKKSGFQILETLEKGHFRDTLEDAINGGKMSDAERQTLRCVLNNIADTQPSLFKVHNDFIFALMVFSGI
ncbi:DNA polymerase I [Aeromonas phage 60AhydR15PP]|uniref:DNA polymerase I n=1 Tax=Aeromonas phage 60AhydR15PP TaxID=2163979 RepID=A0A2S1PGN4_9CAUD|nr:DNA polymerase I [Aeromonas phage 60AhydR15PP]AWH15655.1 DNA polymerase I [Aeromonas phage 60AhydR15PP]UIW13161.1 DNA polymerase I [Aeromonas phage AhMtk13a]